MLKNLSLDTLGDLNDGIVRAIANAAFKQAITDLDDRGHDGKPRVVTLTVTMVTTKGITAIDTKAKATLPEYRSDLTAGKIVKRQTKDGVQVALEFQDLAPTNPDQETLDTFMPRDEAE